MSNIEDRWIELQLYQLLADLQDFSRNQLSVLDAVEVLAVWGKFSSTKAEKLVLDVMSWPHFRPAREELAILAHKAGVDMPEITRVTQLERHTIYRAIQNEAKNPKMWVPRLTLENTKLAKQIIDSHINLRKVGIYGSRTVKETEEHAQNAWTRGIYSEPL